MLFTIKKHWLSKISFLQKLVYKSKTCQWGHQHTKQCIYTVAYTTVQMFGVSKTFIKEGHIKLIKHDSKDICIVKIFIYI